MDTVAFFNHGPYKGARGSVASSTFGASNWATYFVAEGKVIKFTLT